MLTEESAPARTTTVDLTLMRAVDGFWICRAHTLEGALIVLTPKCDTEEGALEIARGMWKSRELLLPRGCKSYAHA